MQRHADISSLEAIDAFRARLIVYQTRTGLAINEVRDEIAHLRVWLRQDRRVFWEHEVHRQEQALALARQQLQSDRLLSNMRSAVDSPRAVHRAERALAEAETKRRIVIREGLQFDHLIDPLARGLDRVQDLLAGDGPKALAYLNRMLDTLRAYTETPAGPGAAGSGQPEERAAGEATPAGATTAALQASGTRAAGVGP
jgi:hypothetical protein